MRSHDWEQLTDAINRASAALTPLAAGFTHDGQTLPGQQNAMSDAIEYAIKAGEIAGRIKFKSPNPMRNGAFVATNPLMTSRVLP